MNQKILVAAVPELDACLVEVLTGHRLFFVRTLDEATRVLEREDFDLVVISVQFDDSRMFDLLRHARTAGRIEDVPILCLREPETGRSPFSGSTLEVTCRALDADAFVDLGGFRDAAARQAALREAVEALLAKRSG